MKIDKKKFEALLVSPSGDFFDEVSNAIRATKERVANTKIALRLLDYMEAHNLSQKQLAQKLNITPQYCSRLLSGRVNVSFAKVEEYFEVLGLCVAITSKGEAPGVSIKENIVARRYKPSQGSPLLMYDNEACYPSTACKTQGMAKEISLSLGWGGVVRHS